jgi:3-deoxy-7-phosphoheptulonate synthase
MSVLNALSSAGTLPDVETLPGADTRIVGYERLISPAALLDELALSEAAAATVKRSRGEVRAVLDGSDDRLLVIAGPCSVHDPVAALEYAGRLANLRDRHRDDLLVVMRVYFEKPRTVTGWKGLINDPDMDGGHDVHRGLRAARQLLLDIVALGLPVGCEFLDPITPQYIADTVTWGAIGARTTESQVHRQLASGLSMPVGFKNGTDGDIQGAVNACRASAGSHTFFGATPVGTVALVKTAGNPDTHVVLRGGRAGPNYGASQVSKALDTVAGAGLPPRLMVDASHDNSWKDHRRQPLVAAALADQVAAGERGLVGVMLESFLREGRQEPGPRATLTYGQSVTDACMDIGTTADVLDGLASAVRSRRHRLPSSNGNNRLPSSNGNNRLPSSNGNNRLPSSNGNSSNGNSSNGNSSNGNFGVVTGHHRGHLLAAVRRCLAALQTYTYTA